MSIRPFALIFLGAWLTVSNVGCLNKPSYPADKLKEAIAQICRDEYNIENIDAKVVGDTIGIYLPLSKLFAIDFKEALVSAKIRNLDSLSEPSAEAMEQIQDVLLSVSRVLLSTDRPLKFYTLYATDTEKTGVQLIISGYVDDIRRVRVWDISRGEYHKRMITGFRLNNAVRWHYTVRQLFKDMEVLPLDEARKKYLGDNVNEDILQKLFFSILGAGIVGPSEIHWEIEDIASAQVQKDEILVYAKVIPHQKKSVVPGTEKGLEYLFMLQLGDQEAKILRIIPFQYRNPAGLVEKTPFPAELNMAENLERWDREFKVDEIHLGPFLAMQLTRRVQVLIERDERIRNTFHEHRLNFEYHQGPPAPYYSLTLDATLKDFNNYLPQSMVLHEDMLYFLSLVLREFVDVLHSYRFADYDYLSLNVVKESSSWIVNRADLELFRQKKADIKKLFMPQTSASTGPTNLSFGKFTR